MDTKENWFFSCLTMYLCVYFSRASVTAADGCIAAGCSVARRVVSDQSAAASRPEDWRPVQHQRQPQRSPARRQVSLDRHLSSAV